MPRLPPIRLRETPLSARPSAQIIDAEFRIVGRRGWLGSVVRFVGALCLAAGIGALIPLAWEIARIFTETRPD